MKVAIIAAMAENRVIGLDNALPWHLPEDLRRFKARTAGHVVIMGRRTWESVGTPLPKRRSIVISRDPGYRAAGAEVVRSLDEALDRARAAGEQEAFILGGAEIYALALPRADRLYLTIVHAEPAGDTRFPEFDARAWSLVEEDRHEADDRHAHAFTFRTYEKPALG